MAPGTLADGLFLPDNDNIAQNEERPIVVTGGGTGRLIGL